MVIFLARVLASFAFLASSSIQGSCGDGGSGSGGIVVWTWCWIS